MSKLPRYYYGICNHENGNILTNVVATNSNSNSILTLVRCQHWVYCIFFFFLLTIRLFELRVLWPSFEEEQQKLDLEVVKVACKSISQSSYCFWKGTFMWGRGTNCSLYQALYLGNAATLRPNPTLNLVLETILVFLGHQSFQGVCQWGGWGESWEGNSSCTCNPCEGSLKQIGSCKAKFGPTHHVYINPTNSPISHFNWLFFVRKQLWIALVAF